jgi:hypothetical protein
MRTTIKAALALSALLALFVGPLVILARTAGL